MSIEGIEGKVSYVPLNPDRVVEGVDQETKRFQATVTAEDGSVTVFPGELDSTTGVPVLVHEEGKPSRVLLPMILD